MSTKLDPIGIPLAYGTLGSGQVLLAASAGVWRRRWLVLGISVAALALGIAVAVMMPARYSAQAYIGGTDTLPMQIKNMNTGTMSAGPMSLDPMRVLETQSRLLQSNQLARRVAEQVGLERLQPLLDKPGWLRSLFKESKASTPEDQLDVGAGKLLRDLTVMSDPRAYLITVRYTAQDPELAILITNAFVAELLRSTRLEALFQQRSYALATLSSQLAKFGERHPKVAALRKELAATDNSLNEQLRELPDAILHSAGENVTKATASPAGPTRAFVVGVNLLVGFMLGIGAALWLERHRWSSA